MTENKQTNEEPENSKKPDITSDNQASNPDIVNRPVWLLQYNADDQVTNWTRDAVPGSIIEWKAGRGLPKTMQADDPVIYWRTTKQGGVAGTGKVISTDTRLVAGVRRFPTTVVQFNENIIFKREAFIKEAGITRRNWQGSVLSLPANVSKKINSMLGAYGLIPLFNDNDGVIHVRRDDAELEHDDLGRAPLAVSLARMLHEIWCTEQGLKPFPNRKPQKYATGFMAHIDAPWGGGKTSFANLIARTLNPNLDNKSPDFLKKLYPNRVDMSGLFMSLAHTIGNLKLPESDEYHWHQDARRPWIIVPYNAWRNQHVNPPWWSFYQTIRKTCFNSIWKEGHPLTIQNSSSSYSTRKENWYSRLNLTVDLWCRELWWRITTPKVVFQLGVVALSVLTAFLIFNYSAEPNGGPTDQWLTTSTFGYLVAFLTGSGSFLIAVSTVISDALAPGEMYLESRFLLVPLIHLTDSGGISPE